MHKNIVFAIICGATAPGAFAATVAEVKAAADASTVTNVTGIVTQVGGSGGRLQFVIQDATGGVVVDKGSLTYTQPQVGDSVTISNGTKSTYFNTVQLAPATAGDIVINSSANALPSPTEYASLAAFSAASNVIVGDYVRVKNVYLTGTLPGGAGATTWLAAADTGNENFTITDNGTDTITLRVPSDLAGAASVYETKTRPTLADSNDRFDVVGVVSIFSGALQVQIANPAGTAAKTDTTGPIRTATVSSSVSDWALYN